MQRSLGILEGGWGSPEEQSVGAGAESGERKITNSGQRGWSVRSGHLCLLTGAYHNWAARPLGTRRQR